MNINNNNGICFGNTELLHTEKCCSLEALKEYLEGIIQALAIYFNYIAVNIDIIHSITITPWCRDISLPSSLILTLHAGVGFLPECFLTLNWPILLTETIVNQWDKRCTYLHLSTFNLIRNNFPSRWWSRWCFYFLYCGDTFTDTAVTVLLHFPVIACQSVTSGLTPLDWQQLPEPQTSMH